MRFAPAPIVLALALATAAGCGGGTEEPATPEEPVTTASKPDPAPEPEPASEPDTGGAMGEETGGGEMAGEAEPASAEGKLGDPEAGAQLYGTYCASCHGAQGAGDGPVSAGLNPKPAAHDDDAYMSTLSDEHIFKVIKEGGTAVGKSALMAPWGGTLSDEQIWDVVAFVRTLHQE